MKQRNRYRLFLENFDPVDVLNRIKTEWPMAWEKVVGKEKWSEEDEDRIRQIERIAQQAGCTQKLQEEIHDWLKSLRPVKQEWDTHDKAIVNCIVCCLDGQFVPEAAIKQALKWFNKHRRDFLNSPSWKPSEEQMEALEYVIRDYREDSCNATANYLQEILDHLKNM